VSARDWLIDAIADIATPKEARAVVDALDAYLIDGPETGHARESLVPNYESDAARLRAERDAAVRLAQETLDQMQRTLDALRGTPEAPGPVPEPGS
jgi:hypothetical protein